jgi:nucleotide-binding universal stress UspA family protein
MAVEEASAKIVVGLDFGEEGERALNTALSFAASFGGADVHVLHVEGGTKSFDAYFEADYNVLDQTVKKCCQAFPNIRGVRVYTHLRSGSPDEQIVKLAADLNADLVVIGMHSKKGLKQLVLGSTAQAVARDAGCQVWIARPKHHVRDETAAQVEPTIEPPCAQCVAKQRETNGAQVYCATHAEKHIVPHRLAYTYSHFEDTEKQGFAPTPQSVRLA